jgi:myo-inositol-1(or 4)-monophosphatase
MRLAHPPSLEEDRALLIAASREAGALAKRYFQAGAKNWEKAHGEPVSEADLAVDTLLREHLGEERPTYGWLSEETEDNPDRLEREKVWVVDPIDGTRAFIKGRPQFAVCAALVVNGAPALGVVFNPMSDEFFFAQAGGGAMLNDKPIQASGKSDLSGLRLLASQRTFEKHNWVDTLPGAEFEAVNSIAYRMALVAAGRYDASVSLSPKSDWDIAAADLIVQEAGGCSTTADGAAFRYNEPSARHPSVLVCAAGLHQDLLALLKNR